MNSQPQLSSVTQPNRWLLWLFFLSSVITMAQSNHTISGIITDKSNGESVFGATVFLNGTNIGGVTNEYGFYSITAPEGSYVLTVSYMGFSDITINIDLTQDVKHDVEIDQLTSELEEVVVKAEGVERAILRKPEMSVAKMNIGTVKQMPVVLGEVDVLKSLQMLPGVANNGEGTGGFHVRGGAQDQNLVLLDEAIIYNTSLCL